MKTDKNLITELNPKGIVLDNIKIDMRGKSILEKETFQKACFEQGLKWGECAFIKYLENEYYTTSKSLFYLTERQFNKETDEDITEAWFSEEWVEAINPPRMVEVADFVGEGYQKRLLVAIHHGTEYKYMTRGGKSICWAHMREIKVDKKTEILADIEELKKQAIDKKTQFLADIEDLKKKAEELKKQVEALDDKEL